MIYVGVRVDVAVRVHERQDVEVVAIEHRRHVTVVAVITDQLQIFQRPHVSTT